MLNMEVTHVVYICIMQFVCLLMFLNPRSAAILCNMDTPLSTVIVALHMNIESVKTLQLDSLPPNLKIKKVTKL